MELKVVHGDLLDQDVEVIVNAWNRNIIPWWLLIPQGVSGAIKRKAGIEPFREVARKGAMPLGCAVETGAGRLPFRAIIHVAGINLFWRSSERAIRGSVRNALALARERGFRSIAFPVIGAGSGGFSSEKSLALMRDEAGKCDFVGEVRIVRFAAGDLLITDRGCYCGFWETKPDQLQSKGIPRGYCGFCRSCGQPGHMRQFPGLLPKDGCWCDHHYKLTKLFHPFGQVGVWVYLGVFIGGLILFAKRVA